MDKSESYHAIRVDEKKCFGCTHCMKACPTEAIRVKNGIAVINSNRCVDCGNCLRVCPAKAFYVEDDDLETITNYKYRVILFPSVMIGQFPEKYSEGQIYEALLKLGFTHIFEVEQPIGVLISALNKEMKKLEIKPLISSFCPAIVRLIQCKYPSLAQNIVPLKAPHDLVALFARKQLQGTGVNVNDIGIFYVSPCSAKFATVRQRSGENSEVNGILNMKDLYNQIMRVISPKETTDTSEYRKYLTDEGILWSLPRGEARLFKKKTMAIDGIHNVVKFLERLENDEVPELDFLELKSCNMGCAGGILLKGNRFLTVERLQKRAMAYPKASKLDLSGIDTVGLQNAMKAAPIKTANAFLLDNDRKKALEKMGKADRILCQLPGIDCGGCGAPNCHALAEDMVQGKARMTDCVFLQKRYMRENKITLEKALKVTAANWGNNRFEADCNKKGGRNEGF
jgi:iron only hydrogenase large subunit-like protein